jgi:hypothetical protein
VQALKAQGVPHPRIVGLIETCEESGSFDLPPYIDALRPRLGDVGLVVCLDSGAGNYDQLWLTTSLRGMVSGTLKVEILTEGMHSGDARAWCPRAFASCARCWTGWKTAPPAACCPPASTARCRPSAWPRRRPRPPSWATRSTSASPGPATADGSTQFALPTTTDPVQALLNRTWRPTLSVTGAEGFPALQDAGNVLRPYTAFKLSLRLPPLVDAAARRAGAQGPAGRQRALPGPRHLRTAAGPAGATGWNAPDHRRGCEAL